jgi:hypothetical protein
MQLKSRSGESKKEERNGRDQELGKWEQHGNSLSSECPGMQWQGAGKGTGVDALGIFIVYLTFKFN